MRRFIDAMNARDFDTVESLLDDNFKIIDNADKVLTGRAECLSLLKRVAEIAPEYQLRAKSIVERGDDILISGASRNTTPEIGSASQWRARATRTHMLEWQSYSAALTPSMIRMIQRADSV
ncbi:nuclear transport factor 2 family protein [Aurantiacibacter hainanensis]|uniref:nuclear transport factor 2 family protein n=1 Tax=Aurantiacibacter hainanensis TaxID=3076114 RepID=UPI0030C71205